MATYAFPAESFTIVGDPGAVAESGRVCGRFSTLTADAAGGIRGLDSTSWVGTEGDLWRAQVAEIPPHLDTAHTAFAQVGRALDGFAEELAAAQRQMAGVLVDAEQTFQSLQTTRRRSDNLKEPSSEQVAADPQAQTAYDDLKQDLTNQVSGLEATFGGHLAAAQRIRGQVLEAARRAGGQIRTAGRTSPTADQSWLEDTWGNGKRWLSDRLDDLKQFIAEHAEGFRFIADALRVIGIALVAIGAIVVVVSWWTGVGAGAGAVTMTVGGLLWGAGDTLDSTVDWVEGKITGRELLMRAGTSMALSLIPGGLGKVATAPAVRRFATQVLVPAVGRGARHALDAMRRFGDEIAGAVNRLSRKASRWVVEEAIPRVLRSKQVQKWIGNGPLRRRLNDMGFSNSNIRNRANSVRDVRRYGGDVDYGHIRANGERTGVTTTVTQGSVKAADQKQIGSPVSRNIRQNPPPGFDAIPPGQRDIAHLSANMHGGSGAVQENVVASYKAANRRMVNYEEMVANAARNGEKVEYRATPIYDGRTRHPTHFELEATGNRGTRFKVRIENSSAATVQQLS